LFSTARLEDLSGVHDITFCTEDDEPIVKHALGRSVVKSVTLRVLVTIGISVFPAFAQEKSAPRADSAAPVVSPLDVIGNVTPTLPAPPLGVVPKGAQTTSTFSGGDCSIAGSVVDQTGAVVVGATVKISRQAGEASTKTDDKGTYIIKGLPPGS